MDLANGHGVQVVELHATQPAAGHEVGVFQHGEVLHHTEARHAGQDYTQLAERLRVAFEETVEQMAASGVSEGSEDVVVHAVIKGDYLVTCQDAKIEHVLAPRVP